MKRSCLAGGRETSAAQELKGNPSGPCGHGIVQREGQQSMAESETKKVTPLLAIDRVTYKKLKVDIKSETHAKLIEYVAFYQKVTGTKASDGEVVGAALERIFIEDKGFVNFTSNGGAVRRPAGASGGGEKGGGSDQT